MSRKDAPPLTADEAWIEADLRDAIAILGRDREACIKRAVFWNAVELDDDEALDVARAMVGAVWDRRIEAAG